MNPPNPDTLFPSTRWTVLHRLREGSEAESRAALETLCRAYWQPLYCVARRRQFSEHDAQDVVQDFFASLLRRETLATAEERAGKLRQLLLRAFDNFCTQQWQKDNRQKRGGGAEHLDFGGLIDGEKAERHYLKTSADGPIEAHYTREWAAAVLECSLAALKEDYARRGWLDRYDLLVGALLQDEETSLEKLATQAGTNAGALRVTLHRMRAHFRDKIERELATTLDSQDPKLIREEMTELFKAFSSP